jgi:hypothetical protein
MLSDVTTLSFCSLRYHLGARGSVVGDEAVYYKPEGRRFEPRMRWNF